MNKYLGNGDTTIILDVTDPENGKDYALRLPRGKKEFDIKFSRRLLGSFVDGYNKLKEYGIPVPRIHESHDEQYILVEKINHKFDLKKLLSHPEGISKEELKEAYKALVKFAERSAYFKQIGDFHAEQLVYSPKKNEWVLLDWHVNHKLVENIDDQAIMSKTFFNKYLLELDSEGEPLMKWRWYGKKEKVKRRLSETEKEFIKLVQFKVEEMRKVLFNREANWAKRIESELTSLSSTTHLTKEEYIELITSYPEKSTNFFRSKLFEAFHNTAEVFEKYNLSIEEVLKIKSALVSSDDDFAKLVELSMSKVKSIEDLDKLIDSHILDQKVTRKTFMRISKLATEKLNLLISTSKLSEVDRNALTRIAANKLYSTSERMKMARALPKHDCMLKVINSLIRNN
ncbi:MAG: hypothetical protein HON90_08935 [Halobacteriovoraceae bacterium]|nr:hypothetical protein [Halobacteriovoraceae bacterium]